MTRKDRYVIVLNYYLMPLRCLEPNWPSFQTAFFYSVPIYVWIYENSAKGL